MWYSTLKQKLTIHSLRTDQSLKPSQERERLIHNYSHTDMFSYCLHTFVFCPLLYLCAKYIMVVKALFTDPVMFIWWFWTQAVIKQVPNKIFDFWQFECNWCLMIYGNSHGYSLMKMYLQIQQRENIERAIPVYLLNYEQDTHWLSLTVGKKFSHCRWRRMRWNANMRRQIYSCRLMKEFSVVLNWKKKKHQTKNKQLNLSIEQQNPICLIKSWFGYGTITSSRSTCLQNSNKVNCGLFWWF